MKIRIYFAILTVIGFTCSYNESFAQSITDAGFESPTINTLLVLGGAQAYNYTGISSPTYIDPSSGTSGWYVSAGTLAQPSVTLVNQGVLSSLLLSPLTGDATSQYMVLNGFAVSLGVVSPDSARGGVSEVLGTTVGTTYRVSYFAGALSAGLGTTGVPQLNAGVDGVTVTSPTGGALINLSVGTFTNQSFTFTATSTQSILDFAETPALGANIGGIAIDNVSITAVPESSHAVVIVLGCLAALILFRKVTSSPGTQA